jgi:hypothetical protein
MQSNDQATPAAPEVAPQVTEEAMPRGQGSTASGAPVMGGHPGHGATGSGTESYDPGPGATSSGMMPAASSEAPPPDPVPPNGLPIGPPEMPPAVPRAERDEELPLQRPRR